MMTTVSPSRTILLRAVEILKTMGWTRHSMAKDNRGHSIGPTDPRATCFCALGAVRRAAFDLGTPNDSIMVTRARRALDLTTGGVVTFNDDIASCKEDVIKKFLEASFRV